MTNIEAANIVAEQLAGGTRKLVAMVGARDLVAIPGGLQFKFMKTERTKANVVRIEVNGATDLYTVSFLKIRSGKVEKVGEFADTFCGDLRKLFEEFTGLALGF